MTPVLTSDEIKALTQKLNTPDADVACPRCGKLLAFAEIGNSCEVKCPSDSCLYDSIRGL